MKLSKLKWGQARKLHYTRKNWLRAKKISKTLKQKFKEQPRTRRKGRFVKPTRENKSFIIVGGFDYKLSKRVKKPVASGKQLSLEIEIEIIEKKDYPIEKAIKDIDWFVRNWFVDNFGGLDIKKLGFDIGLDSEHYTDQKIQTTILQLDFNRPFWKNILEKDLISLLQTL